MKYFVMLGDGMADRPVPELGGKTPLEAANKPCMDALCREGCLVGMVHNVPEGMAPGSDTANLSAMGYDPKVYYTGRSPLEAANIGVEFTPEDVTYRMNFVTLSDEASFPEKRIVDYCADEISSEESAELIRFLKPHFETEILGIFHGITYRHCLLIRGGLTGAELTPPHDITGSIIGEYLPKGQYSDLLLSLMEKSYDLLRDHPINKKRIETGLNPANAVWFWGEGRKPDLTPFEEKFQKRGGIISAVDLLQGIGVCTGMKIIKVPGATGNSHTNFKGKGEAALKALLEDGLDFVYVHVEAPDECGHRHEVKEKVEAIELIDRLVLSPIVEGLRAAGESFAMILMPDHPTPLCLKTHTSDPVPFVMYRSDAPAVSGAARYTEAEAASTGVLIPEGHVLMGKLFENA